jgi:anti-sigma regulatory factor (Ser/Thr protein kinase)
MRMNTTVITSDSHQAPAVVRGTGPNDIVRARQATRTFIGTLSPAPDPTAADALILVVSELVTNAVRHGGGRYVLELSADADTLSAAVTDRSPAPPREHTPVLGSDSSGLGWYLIRLLTSHVSISAGPGPGKTIHARLPR